MKLRLRPDQFIQLPGSDLKLFTPWWTLLRRVEFSRNSNPPLSSSDFDSLSSDLMFSHPCPIFFDSVTQQGWVGSESAIIGASSYFSHVRCPTFLALSIDIQNVDFQGRRPW